MNVKNILKTLSLKRKIFYSEADFQHALAWEIHNIYPSISIRLEYPFKIDKEIYYIDILVQYKGTIIPIELKYKTKQVNLFHKEEQYILKNHGAQDCGRYDFLWDIYRLEKVKSVKNNVNGYVIFLTNDNAYWKEPNQSGTIDEMFKIHEGRTVSGCLSWSDKASLGTKKGREQNIILKNKYKMSWDDYSVIDIDRYNSFKYLFIKI